MRVLNSLEYFYLFYVFQFARRSRCTEDGRRVAGVDAMEYSFESESLVCVTVGVLSLTTCKCNRRT